MMQKINLKRDSCTYKSHMHNIQAIEIYIKMFETIHVMEFWIKDQVLQQI